MATKRYTKNDLTKILAFAALLLAAVIWALSAFGVKNYILAFIKDAALLAAISLPAHSFAKSIGRIWVIIFWVIFSVFAISLVLGSFPL